MIYGNIYSCTRIVQDTYYGLKVETSSSCTGTSECAPYNAKTIQLFDMLKVGARDGLGKCMHGMNETCCMERCNFTIDLLVAPAETLVTPEAYMACYL